MSFGQGPVNSIPAIEELTKTIKENNRESAKLSNRIYYLTIAGILIAVITAIEPVVKFIKWIINLD